MGMQDRDYYWEHRAKLDAETEKKRVSLKRLFSGSKSKKYRPWHPLLTFLVTFFLCFLVYLSLGLIAKIRVFL